MNNPTPDFDELRRLMAPRFIAATVDYLMTKYYAGTVASASDASANDAQLEQQECNGASS